MSAGDPKHVIVAYLSLSVGEVVSQPDTAARAALKDGRWVRPGVIRRGGGMGAKAATITFLKERCIPGRQVHAVAFEDEAGYLWDYVYFVAQDEQGNWHVEMGGGGGRSNNNSPHPTRPHPRADLAGGGWENRFWAGGRVSANGFEIARVRLTSRNGMILEDTVDDGLVLFVSDQKVQVPVKVELYTRSGELVGTHSQFGDAGAAGRMMS